MGRLRKLERRRAVNVLDSDEIKAHRELQSTFDTLVSSHRKRPPGTLKSTQQMSLMSRVGEGSLSPEISKYRASSLRRKADIAFGELSSFSTPERLVKKPRCEVRNQSESDSSPEFGNSKLKTSLKTPPWLRHCKAVKSEDLFSRSPTRSPTRSPPKSPVEPHKAPAQPTTPEESLNKIRLKKYATEELQRSNPRQARNFAEDVVDDIRRRAKAQKVKENEKRQELMVPHALDNNAEIPGHIAGRLRNYQVKGVEWLYSRYCAGQGSILGDDMGLGKTIQMIAFMAAVRSRGFSTPVKNKKQRSRDHNIKTHIVEEDCLPDSLFDSLEPTLIDDLLVKTKDEEQKTITKGGEEASDLLELWRKEAGERAQAEDVIKPTPDNPYGPFLVVVPSSVLGQWKEEFTEWAPEFRVKICHGETKFKVMRYAAELNLDVLLTTYETMRMFEKDLFLVPWTCAIFDEVHRLKNHKGLSNPKDYEPIGPKKPTMPLFCKQIPVSVKIGMTGTLVQNNYDELWTIMEIICPGELGMEGRKEFKEYYSLPIKKGKQKSASHHEIYMMDKREKELRAVTNQCCLRREKALIADQLPKKKDNIVFCRMSEIQIATYRRLMALPEFDLVRRSKEPCDCGSGKKRGRCCHRSVPNPVISNNQRHRLNGYPCDRCPTCAQLPCLKLLTKVANHPELLKVDKCDKPELNQKLKVARLAFGEDLNAVGGEYRCRTFQEEANSGCSGKIKTLEILLEEWKKRGSKILLFSQYTTMLDILETFCKSKGYSYFRLDGSVPTSKRQTMVKAFNKTPTVFLFLISSMAGGIGLNLTSANVVVIFEPHFNPSYDLQAQDRAFRIGQKKDVSVFRLFSSGSVEENIYHRQVYKQQLAIPVFKDVKGARYFEGVQGIKGEEGNLFGMENLFKFDPDKRSTKELLQGTYVVEKMKYLELAEAEVADSDEVMKKIIGEGGVMDGYLHSDVLKEEKKERELAFEAAALFATQEFFGKKLSQDLSDQDEKSDSPEKLAPSFPLPTERFYKWIKKTKHVSKPQARKYFNGLSSEGKKDLLAQWQAISR